MLEARPSKMSSFTVQALEEKLSRLSASQDSIETLSLWIIHHKAHATMSVTVWMEKLEKADADRRLTLLYLANDILQNGRRRGTTDFEELFRDPLRQAAMMVRGEKIQTSVERMLRIWKERKVYSNNFIKELEQLIEPEKVKGHEEVPHEANFKLSLLADALSELQKFEGEMKVKSSHLANLRMDVSDTSTLTQLKDKSEGGKFSAEFEEASQKLQDYCECLGIEVNERVNIVDMLEEGKACMSRQLAELQLTAKNYRDLGVLVKEVRDKLELRVKELARAQETATSDPSAKEDITDVGDMEIDSDTDAQESVDTSKPSLVPNSHPPPMVQRAPPIVQRAPPIVQRAPPMVQRAPPMVQRAPPMVQRAPPFIQRAPPMNHPPIRPVQRPVLPPRGFPGMQAPYQQHPLFRQELPRPYLASRAPYQPHPPLQQQRPRAPVYPVRHPLARVPLVTQPPPRAPRPMNMIRAPLVMYTATQPSSVQPQPHTSAPPTQTPLQNSAPNVAPPPADNVSPSAGLQSLDERLKDMVSHKAFPKVLLTDYSDSDTDSEGKGHRVRPQGMETEMPYSPSGEDLIISDPCTPLDKDDESIPTPNTEIPTPEEASPGPPQLNMNNPILQVLYRSQEPPTNQAQGPQTSPSLPDKPLPTAVPNLSTGILQQILSQVSTARPLALPTQVNPPSSTDILSPSPRTMGVGLTEATPTTTIEGGAIAVRTSLPSVVGPGKVETNMDQVEGVPKVHEGQSSHNLKGIKITPKLTTLLDEIFPQLSKTLQMDRKRKLETGPPLPEQKVQKMESSWPLPMVTSTAGRTVIDHAHRGGTPVMSTAQPTQGLHPLVTHPRGLPPSPRAPMPRVRPPAGVRPFPSPPAFRHPPPPSSAQSLPGRIFPPPRQPMAFSPGGPRLPMDRVPRPLPPNSRFPSPTNHFPPKPFPPYLWSPNSIAPPTQSYNARPPPPHPMSVPPTATHPQNRPRFM